MEGSESGGHDGGLEAEGRQGSYCGEFPWRLLEKVLRAGVGLRMTAPQQESSAPRMAVGLQ